MNTYMLTLPHTPDECLEALGATADVPKLLSKTKFGCNNGDHTGYAMLDAQSDTEISNLIPQPLRSKAKITKVESFTAAQIASFHSH